MVIMGSGGHAKEVLEVLMQNGFNKTIAFYNDVTPDAQLPEIFKNYAILQNQQSLKAWFSNESPDFVLGVGGITNRKKLWNLATEHGGKPIDLMASNCSIGHLDVELGPGLNAMQFVFVSNSVTIGQSVLLNTRCHVHHDVTIGDFSEIGPGALLLGNCSVGNNTFIGAGAVILPGINVGENCVVGAGAVVTKNVGDKLLVKGNPAK